MNCADTKALPIARRRAVRAAGHIWVVVAALSIFGVAQTSAERSIGLGGPVNSVQPPNHLALEPSRGAVHGWSRPGTFRKFAVPTFVALQALDAGATEYGFHQRNWVEHNPLIPHSTAGRMTYFGLTGAGVVLGSAWLEHRGHGRLSKVLLVGAIAVEGYAASHSLAGLQR